MKMGFTATDWASQTTKRGCCDCEMHTRIKVHICFHVAMHRQRAIELDGRKEMVEKAREVPKHHDVKCERHHDDKIMEVSCTELLQKLWAFFEMPNNVTMSVPMVTAVGNIIMVESHLTMGKSVTMQAKERVCAWEIERKAVATKRNGKQGTSM